jgi:hypothetical protein
VYSCNFAKLNIFTNEPLKSWAGGNGKDWIYPGVITVFGSELAAEEGITDCLMNGQSEIFLYNVKLFLGQSYKPEI